MTFADLLDPRRSQLATGAWVLRMTWHDLLFAHWPVAGESLQPLLPDGLKLETYGGQAWLGVTPFWMSDVRPRLMPPVPTAGRFNEINVRTYVTDGRVPGIWFFSLDAHSQLAVISARLGYALNYYYADIDRQCDGDWTIYRSRRAGGRARFIGRYRAVGELFRPAPDSLEHWLTERYHLYAGGLGQPLYRGQIEHEPWTLRGAEVEIETNTMTLPLGVDLPPTPPHTLFAARKDVVAFWPRRI